MNIPETAYEAAAEGICDAAFGQELPEAPIDLARAALTAALPHIRAQIAADIRAESAAANWAKTFRNGLEHAAQTVEEGNPK